MKKLKHCDSKSTLVLSLYASFTVGYGAAAFI